VYYIAGKPVNACQLGFQESNEQLLRRNHERDCNPATIDRYRLAWRRCRLPIVG
jgi:hypothetical protein